MKIKANGIDINYAFDGPADAPVVTLSHSLACNIGMWEPQMAALARRFRVLRFDCRGHGQSDVTGGAYHFDGLADDARALLQALGIAKTHWVGLSMGGMTGMSLAIRYPEMLSSLSLCDTMSGANAAYRGVSEERIRIAETKGMEAHVEPTIARWFTAPFVAKNPPVLVKVREMIRTTPVKGYVGVCHALIALDYTARLKTIRLPTLIIVGEEDVGTPVAASELMHREILGSKLVILKQASHLSNIEQPEAFNAALLDFLAAQAK